MRLAFAALALLAGVSFGQAEPVAVTARPITEFQIGREGTRFGPLEFVGGLELTSGARDFGSFSALRFLGSDGRFMGVSDIGNWFFGRITRDAEGRPNGIADFSLEPILDALGDRSRAKQQVDAESLTLSGDTAMVGFERNHRVVQYALKPSAMGKPLRKVPFLIPPRELRTNRGIEALVTAPADGPLRGALVAVTERSLDAQGNLFAAVLAGPRKGLFSVVRHDPFDVSDGAFLPNGDLLLLERSYSFPRGVGLRLRRIAGESIKPGAVVDGPILFTADMSYQIDNMEGLDVWRRADGRIAVSMISDDNQSIFQRNLYLEFVLAE
ncbi:MAG: esterase-like activity of phytase family protein [Methylobacterium mesophilicum]|nr:esterase-like activity of phytase family protein [Methylobacterium mesophilicum]